MQPPWFNWISWRYYIRFFGFYSWFPSTDIWTNSYIVEFTVLHWPYLYWSTKFSSWRWCSSYLFGIFNPLRLKLITRLQLGLSHLNEHRFNHNFNGCINPLCTAAWTYSLHCNYYNIARISLLNYLNSVDRTLLKDEDRKIFCFHLLSL